MIYVDSSALVKLAIPERESSELLEFIEQDRDRISSVVCSVEVRRAVRRATDDPAAHRLAERLLTGVHLLWLDTEIVEHAAALSPASIGSLDAIHLGSALSLRAELGAFVTYDRRLQMAAVDAALPVEAPGS